MPTMTQRQFLDWINPEKQYHVNDHQLTLPDFRKFSKLDWLKTYLTNPVWAFSHDAKGRRVPTDVQLRIITHLMRMNPNRIATCYKKYYNATPFIIFIDEHFPEIQLLLV